MNEVDYLDIDKAFILNNNNSEICVIKNNIDYYFKLNLKSGYQKMVIFSNRAADRSKANPPIFMRHTWAEDINASCIFVDDRTIHDSQLMIGWGIGRKNIHYLSEVSLILRKILKTLEFSHDNCIYYGSSAGGMMSMILSIKHRYSKAIVNNPQMITYNYMNGKPLSYIKNNFFKDYTYDEFVEKYKERLSIPHLMKEQNYVPRVLYILNKLSPMDYEDQFLPFVKEIENSELKMNKIEYLLYNHSGLGHNPLPKGRSVKIINAAIDDIFLVN